MPPTHLLAAPGLRLGPTRPRVQRAAVEDARAGGGRRLILLATVLLAVAGALGFLKTWPPFATVMSASMAPTINTGDIVILKRLDGPAAVGQVVQVHVPAEARSRYGYPPVVIHRITKIAPDGAVTTKGDAKAEVDPFTVPRSAITTRVFTHIPAAGQAFSFLRSSLGLLWLAGGAALFLGLPLLERYRDAQRQATDERDERERVLEELRVHVELLPVQIERAVANAVAAVEPRPAPVPAPVAEPAPVTRIAPGIGVFALPSEEEAPAPRIVSAAALAAVAAARLQPAPAPPAPPVPQTRVPAPRPVASPLAAVAAFSFRPEPAPPAPEVPETRALVAAEPLPALPTARFQRMPAPPAPPAPLPATAPRLVAASRA